MANTQQRFDPVAVDLIDTLIRKARNSQYRDTCTGMTGDSRDYRKADEAEDAQNEARELLLNHLGIKEY